MKNTFVSRSRVIACFTACLFSLSMIVNEAAQAQGKHLPPPEMAVFKPFIGKWIGTLEYSDYQTKQRVKLPMTLTLKITTDGFYLVSDYGYQDPGVIVEEIDLTTIDPKTHQLVNTSFSRGSTMTTSDSVTGIAEILAKGQGQISYTRDAHDDDIPVEIRETDTYAPDHLTFLTEGRGKPTDPFVFRDEITLKRQGQSH